MSRRDEMVAAAAEAIDNELINGDYGDASGHLGGDGIRSLAAAAVDAVLEVCAAVSQEGYPCDRTGPHDTHTHLMECGATATWVDRSTPEELPGGENT